MEFGILCIADIKTTDDEQFIFFAHTSGQVNMHYIGDNSFTFVTSLQSDFPDSCYQKVEVFSKVTKGVGLPQAFCDSFICCLSSYDSVQISRLKNLQSLVSVHGKLHS